MEPRPGLEKVMDVLETVNKEHSHQRLITPVISEVCF